MPSSLSINESINVFIRNLHNRYCNNSLETYFNSLKQFNSSIPVNYLSDVNRQHVKEWILLMKEEGYSSTSIALKLMALKMFFKYCQVEGLINDNPAKGVKAPKITLKSPEALNDGVMFKLRELCGTNLRDRAILETLYFTGIRVSELTEIKIVDLDFDDRTIKIHGKGGVERFVFFSTICAEHLHRYLNARTDTSPFLFRSVKSYRITRQGVWKIIKDYAKKAGLEQRIFPHKFRTEFVSVLAEKGFRDEEIMELLGHKDPFSVQRYKHITEQARKKAYDQFHLPH